MTYAYLPETHKRRNITTVLLIHNSTRDAGEHVFSAYVTIKHYLVYKQCVLIMYIDLSQS